MNDPAQADNNPAPFGDRLHGACQRRNSVLCVGLDPHLDLLPPEFGQAITGDDRERCAEAIHEFCLGILEAVADLIPVVKPQVAFFERLGPPGWSCLEGLCAAARERDLLVISDAKRGDIGTTASAYADYHLGRGGLDADAVTVNPYMGADSMAPYARYFRRGKGLFALARTSNRGADTMQLNPEPPHPADRVGGLCRELDHALPGQTGLRPTGLVAGATRADEAQAIRQANPDLPLLIPGLGAQGARASDLAGCFNPDGLGAVVNASRSVLFAYRESGVEDWAGAARREAARLNEALNAARQR